MTKFQICKFFNLYTQTEKRYPFISVSGENENVAFVPDSRTRKVKIATNRVCLEASPYAFYFRQLHNRLPSSALPIRKRHLKIHVANLKQSYGGSCINPTCSPSTLCANCTNIVLFLTKLYILGHIPRPRTPRSITRSHNICLEHSDFFERNQRCDSPVRAVDNRDELGNEYYDAVYNAITPGQYRRLMARPPDGLLELIKSSPVPPRFEPTSIRIFQRPQKHLPKEDVNRHEEYAHSGRDRFTDFDMEDFRDEDNYEYKDGSLCAQCTRKFKGKSASKSGLKPSAEPFQPAINPKTVEQLVDEAIRNRTLAPAASAVPSASVAMDQEAPSSSVATQPAQGETGHPAPAPAPVVHPSSIPATLPPNALPQPFPVNPPVVGNVPDPTPSAPEPRQQVVAPAPAHQPPPQMQPAPCGEPMPQLMQLPQPIIVCGPQPRHCGPPPPGFQPAGPGFPFVPGPANCGPRPMFHQDPEFQSHNIRPPHGFEGPRPPPFPTGFGGPRPQFHVGPGAPDGGPVFFDEPPFHFESGPPPSPPPWMMQPFPSQNVDSSASVPDPHPSFGNGPAFMPPRPPRHHSAPRGPYPGHGRGRGMSGRPARPFGGLDRDPA